MWTQEPSGGFALLGGARGQPDRTSCWRRPGDDGLAGAQESGTKGGRDPVAPGKDFSNPGRFRLSPRDEVRDVNEGY
jgi:hypothetical protein